MKVKYLIIGDKKLTPREQQIISHIIRAHPNKMIAGLLPITVNTVKTEISHLYAKFGFHSRSQLVAWAMTNGWDISGNHHPKVLTLFD